MRSLATPLLALLLVAPATGCLSLFPAGEKSLQVEGPTRGYSPTASYLKVHVDTPDGRRVLVDFDRRDWHVAELARRLDARQVDFLAVEGTQRLIGEVVAGNVHAPEEVAALRYAAMSVSEEDRLRLDAEYDDLLARLATEHALPDAPAPAAPHGPLPGLGQA